jgi:hypothetical protein
MEDLVIQSMRLLRYEDDSAYNMAGHLHMSTESKQSSWTNISREGGLEANGPVAWPARSPALNPLDFFLWDCMKSRVYHNGKPEGRHQLV